MNKLFVAICSKASQVLKLSVICKWSFKHSSSFKAFEWSLNIPSPSCGTSLLQLYREMECKIPRFQYLFVSNFYCWHFFDLVTSQQDAYSSLGTIMRHCGPEVNICHFRTRSINMSLYVESLLLMPADQLWVKNLLYDLTLIIACVVKIIFLFSRRKEYCAQVWKEPFIHLNRIFWFIMTFSFCYKCCNLFTM